MKGQIVDFIKDASGLLRFDDINNAREYIRILTRATNDPNGISERTSSSSLAILEKYSNILRSVKSLAFEQLESSASDGIHAIANVLNVKNLDANQDAIFEQSEKSRNALHAMSSAILAKKVAGNIDELHFSLEHVNKPKII